MPKPTDDLIHRAQFPPDTLKVGRFTVYRRERDAANFHFIAALDNFESAWNIGRASGGDLETIVVQFVYSGDYCVWFSPALGDYQRYSGSGQLTDNKKLSTAARASVRTAGTLAADPGHYAQQVDAANPNPEPESENPAVIAAVVADAFEREYQPSQRQLDALHKAGEAYKIKTQRVQDRWNHVQLLRLAAPIMAQLFTVNSSVRAEDAANVALNAAEVLIAEWEKRKP